MTEEQSSLHLARAGYRAWDRKEFLKAADLFFRAAEASVRESEGRTEWGPPDSSFSYKIRGALCLFETGETKRSIRILQEATTFDWKAARLWNDRHVLEQVFACLIRSSARNRDLKAYQNYWKQALNSQLTFNFPSGEEAQEQLLDVCMKLEDKFHCAQIVRKIRRRRKKISKELDAKLHRADRLLYS